MLAWTPTSLPPHIKTAGRQAFATTVLTVLAACGACQDPEPKPITADDPLLDAATCEECHPTHYREWLGSMHAYAGEDPIFLAMNARGQRETNGELGDFCVRCHAPMALELGLTTDGLNLAELPQQVRGVTCYFCHTVTAVEGAHNNPLTLSGERTMLGAIMDPVDNDVHASDYSPFLDSRTTQSAAACGTCHDLVNPQGVHLERTYAEWQESLFSDIDPLTGGLAVYGQSCGTCHFGRPEDGPIADMPGVRADRQRHPHGLAGVDVALHDWPTAELGPQLRAEQLALIEKQREPALCATICVGDRDAGGSNVDVYLHNEAAAAHAWPSGATQDRRAWLELRAFAGDDALLELGVIDDGVPVASIDEPAMWQLRSFMYGDDGHEVHMFWDATSTDGNLLPPSAVLSAMGDAATWRSRRFEVADGQVDRVTTRLRIRPVGLDVIDSLIDSGDLDPLYRERIDTFDVEPTVLEWTADVAEDFDGYGACVSSSSVCGAPMVGAAPVQ